MQQITDYINTFNKQNTEFKLVVSAKSVVLIHNESCDEVVDFSFSHVKTMLNMVDISVFDLVLNSVKKAYSVGCVSGYLKAGEEVDKAEAEFAPLKKIFMPIEHEFSAYEKHLQSCSTLPDIACTVKQIFEELPDVVSTKTAEKCCNILFSGFDNRTPITTDTMKQIIASILLSYKNEI